jgi:heptosyltransferase-2
MRILVVQTAFLGDIVLTTPLLRELKRAGADRRITVATTPLGAAILAGHPHVDEIVVHDKRGRERRPLGLLRAIARVRGGRFDAAIAAQRSSRTGMLLVGSGAKRRVGFAGAPGAWGYTDRVRWDGARHAVHRYLALSAPLGGDPEAADPRPVLAVGEQARARVASLLSTAGIAEGEDVLAIAPGSIWGTKRWTPSGFADVARAAARLGLRPVLVGSPDERALCLAIAETAGEGVSVLAGSTGPADLAALLARSRALVGGDSGPGHVASAVGTPVVAIFGPTVPAFGYTPYGSAHRVVEHEGLACRPCDRHGPQTCPLGHHRCMVDVPAGRVLAALSEVLLSAPDRR